MQPALLATFVVCPKPESGHFNPTLRLAKKLRGRGHEVVYFVHRHFAPRVEREGFEVVVLSDDVSYQGDVNGPDRLEPHESFEAREARLRVSTFEQCRTGTVWAPLAGRRVDLHLIDFSWFTLALSAAAHRRPSVLLCVTLLPSFAGGPPLGSLLDFDGRLRTRLRSRIAWLRLRFAMRGSYRSGRALARSLGLSELVATEIELVPRVRLPTLVMCPAAFDFPGIRMPPDTLRGGPYIDVDRAEASFDWAALRLDDETRLVYCSLGSLVDAFEGARAFFERLLVVFSRKPSWRLVLATGIAQLGNVPPNVHLVRYAPQLEVLKRAHVAIVHGGINSVKECIAHGVPVLVVPWTGDMPGNAARVVHHGLGLHADVQAVTSEALEHAIGRLMLEPSFRAHCALMRASFAASDASDEDVEWIEAYGVSGSKI